MLDLLLQRNKLSARINRRSLEFLRTLNNIYFLARRLLRRVRRQHSLLIRQTTTQLVPGPDWPSQILSACPLFQQTGCHSNLTSAI